MQGLGFFVSEFLASSIEPRDGISRGRPMIDYFSYLLLKKKS